MVGSYLAYVSLLGQLINPMRNLGRLLVDMSTGIVSYKRMMQVIGEEQESPVDGTHVPDGDLRGDVEFKHVNFQYNADTPVLYDIDLSVKAGKRRPTRS